MQDGQAQLQQVVAQQQQVLQQVQGELAQLVAEEEARRRAEEERLARERYQAQLAAEQARAAQQAATREAQRQAAAAQEQAAATPRPARPRRPPRRRPTSRTRRPGAAGADVTAAVVVLGSERHRGHRLGQRGRRGRPQVPRHPVPLRRLGPNNFDCSGLTAYVYREFGVSMPHSAEWQYNQFPHVSRDDLQPGDLVFFGSPIHHVGIYVGNGQMLDAPHTGTVVQIRTMLRNDYAGAARPAI